MRPLKHRSWLRRGVVHRRSPYSHGDPRSVVFNVVFVNMLGGFVRRAVFGTPPLFRLTQIPDFHVFAAEPFHETFHRRKRGETGPTSQAAEFQNTNCAVT